MTSASRSLALLALLALAGLVPAPAQTPGYERVDPTLRRRTEIDGNNLRTSVFNFAFSGRTGAGQGVPYEWPKNTGRYYVALVGLFIGAEVRDDTGGVARIVDLPAYRQNPATGGDWNMGPVGGYFNPNQPKIAKSDEPNTYPAFWPDKLDDPTDPGWRKESATNEDLDPGRAAWNGFFGKNQFSADQEMFYRVGDDNYDRYRYTPDTLNPSRRGLGMLVDVRVLEWSQVSVADAAFFIQEVRNAGTKDLPKTAVTLWLADFVGGDGDSQDDRPDFDLILDIAFSLDADGISSNPAFQGAFVGAAATIYLETPGNATDNIDNDGDSPDSASGPKVTVGMIQGEVTGNQIDDNGNGLIDEDSTYIQFGTQRGVTFRDRIANNTVGEPNSPRVTPGMIAGETAGNAIDDNNNGAIDEDNNDVGRAYADGIDNGTHVGRNGYVYRAEAGSPTVRQSMIDSAATNGRRFRVNARITLYDVGTEDLGKAYADGIDNDGNGQVDEGIDEDIDVMIDESRNDGIDNDEDWTLRDDVGLDGARGTNDRGEGDGIPTSGVGTGFPGEPNIDKTDVSEADQIGLTNVQYLAAGAINFSTTPDGYFWGEFMLPGSFVDPSLIPTGESDLFVSSGVFPLKAGQIERISYAVVMGAAVRGGNADVSGAKADALRKREFAVLAYNEDYQFAQAPIEPTVTAVPGNKKVTLYWDALAEESEDRFLAGIPGAPAKDFEGYRIYRATDPAFEDARVITDAYGSPAPWLKPIVQYDLKNGIKGIDSSISFNGVKFDLGSDNGLVHSWVDTGVVNGVKYYYAVRAYDRGYNPLGITPAESNLKISIDNVTGQVTSIGTSVAIVTPQAAAGGYTAPELSPIALVRGTTTGEIDYTIVDPTKVRDKHRYRVTFTDTVLAGADPTVPDTFKTQTFTLLDITDPDSTRWVVLIDSSRAVGDTVEQPLTDGFRLALRNEKFFGVNQEKSRWSRPNVWPFAFAQWKSGFTSGVQKPSDYLIVFGQRGVDTSTAYQVDPFFPTLPAQPVNFRVFNTSENRQIDFAFLEQDLAGGPGIFSARGNEPIQKDDIILLEPNLQDSLVTTWTFTVSYDTINTQPAAGDSAIITLAKIFRADDVFEFTTTAQGVNQELAKSSLDRIRVVPNPYVVTAEWEEKSPYSSGRGPRKIQFTNLPQRCTIRIYTVSGELVRTIEHDAPIIDGSESWDLLTRDNLAVSYGLYIFHVDAPGVGEKIGKFALIK